MLIVGSGKYHVLNLRYVEEGWKEFTYRMKLLVLGSGIGGHDPQEDMMGRVLRHELHMRTTMKRVYTNAPNDITALALHFLGAYSDGGKKFDER